MPIPDFQSFMLPVLKVMGDGVERSMAQIREAVAAILGVSDEERKELLPSGTQPVFDNRTAWACIYLTRAVLLRRIRRGWYQITERGEGVLQEAPARIDVKFLDRYEEFLVFRGKIGPINGGEGHVEPTNPEERLEAAYQELKESLAVELIQAIKACSPEFFERLVIDVLVKMGYGGSRREAGQAVGRAACGDEGHARGEFRVPAAAGQKRPVRRIVVADDMKSSPGRFKASAPGKVSLSRRRPLARMRWIMSDILTVRLF